MGPAGPLANDKRPIAKKMDHSQHNRNVNFIWSIADDELREVYANGFNSQSRNKSGKNLLFPRSTA